MSIIRQESLFDIQNFNDMTPSKRFEAIFSASDIKAIVFTISKESIYGTPPELNYAAMIYALVMRIHEGIPNIKLLVKRLILDILFRLDCRILLSDQTLSNASFSRLIGKLSESQILEEERDSVILQAIEEGFVMMPQLR
ncbi:transposase [Psychrobacillus sp. INOP01]|uniref:transposase n=1 Tax=Psychrobacillus sp. INOP01 TaxID=2829187 RepID=UPI001BA765A9|nr:transposase [Psychrobacillus sp. INOP01]QUG40597.1 transposase [Psychrobacillus sp. INOP01]